MIGILAYGSLLADPGPEIEAATERRIESVQTPFEVEYARSSAGRAGAPTLVRVANGKGSPVQAQIFILRPETGEQEARNMLYRRETNRVGRRGVVYDESIQQQLSDAVLIGSLADVAGVSRVFYAHLGANIDRILTGDLSAEEKARTLAKLAIDSVSERTYAERRDGIQYLRDAMRHSVQTPLTEPYETAIRRMADHAPDLEAARLRIAQCKGIILKEGE